MVPAWGHGSSPRAGNLLAGAVQGGLVAGGGQEAPREG